MNRASSVGTLAPDAHDGTSPTTAREDASRPRRRSRPLERDKPEATKTLDSRAFAMQQSGRSSNPQRSVEHLVGLLLDDRERAGRGELVRRLAM